MNSLIFIPVRLCLIKGFLSPVSVKDSAFQTLSIVHITWRKTISFCLLESCNVSPLNALCQINYGMDLNDLHQMGCTGKSASNGYFFLLFTFHTPL